MSGFMTALCVVGIVIGIGIIVMDIRNVIEHDWLTSETRRKRMLENAMREMCFGDVDTRKQTKNRYTKAGMDMRGYKPWTGKGLWG